MSSPTLSRTSSGLLLFEDFSDDQSPWATTGGFAPVYEPTLLCYGYSPIHMVDPGASGTADAGGVREFTPYFDKATGTVYLYYGAGRDSSDTTQGAWKPQLATSTDRISFTKLGAVLPNNGLSNGTTGTYPARDMGWVEKRGATYYLHSVVAGSTVAGPSGKSLVPGQPYTSDIWSSSSLLGPWTYVGPFVALGSGTSFDSASAYVASIIADPFGNLRAFYGTNQSGSSPLQLNVGIATSAGPGPNPGAYAKTSGPILAATNNLPENADVFWHPLLNCWAMLQNEVSQPGVLSAPDFNSIRCGESLTDWMTAPITLKYLTHVSSMHGPIANGYLRAFRISENGIYMDANGNIPATYDGFPDGSSGTASATGRRGLWTVLEPSPRALLYTPAGGTTTVFEDTFQATAGTTLASYGNGWAVDSTAGGVPTITSSGVLSMGTSAGATRATQTGVATQTDSCSATFNEGATGTSDAITIVDVATDTMLYFIDAGYVTSTAAPTLSIYTGSNTQVGSQILYPGSDAPANTSYVLKVIPLSSTSIQVYINTTSMGTFTLPTAITAPFHYGLRNGNGLSGARNVTDFKITATTTDPGHTYRRSLAHGDFFGQLSLDYGSTSGSPALGLDYRIQSSGDSYRCVLTPGAGLSLLKSTGGSAGVPGTYSTLANSTGTQVSTATYHHHVVVSVVGNLHKLYLDGELQVTYTDAASPYTSGSSVGIFGKGASAYFRRLTLMSSPVVTVTGLTSGQAITFYAADLIPLENTTASGTSYASSSLVHFGALNTISVAGTALQLPGAPPIYGGDVLAYSASSGSGTAATAYSVVGIPSTPVVGETYPVAVILNGPAGSSFTATFGAATGITWGGAATIAAGAVSATTTVEFTAAGTYTPTVTHTGGGFSGDPTLPGATAAAGSGSVSDGSVTADVTAALVALGYTSARAAKLDNLDAAVSTRSTLAGPAGFSSLQITSGKVAIDLTQPLTLRDQTSVTAPTINDGLAAAHAGAVGAETKPNTPGTTTGTLKHADGSTARTFTYDSGTVPTQRT